MAESKPDDLVYRSKLQVSSTIKIPLADLDFQFVRSSGPGGQHVNKTNSKVQLFWNVAESEIIGRNLKLRFMDKYANQISTAGVLLIESQTHRDQHLNKRVALQKLQKMIRSVARPPKPRKPTKPTKASKRKRLENKAQQSEKKKTTTSQNGRQLIAVRFRLSQNLCSQLFQQTHGLADIGFLFDRVLRNFSLNCERSFVTNFLQCSQIGFHSDIALTERNFRSP